jgi:hypothetical protein
MPQVVSSDLCRSEIGQPRLTKEPQSADYKGWIEEIVQARRSCWYEQGSAGLCSNGASFAASIGGGGADTRTRLFGWVASTDKVANFA